MIITRNLFKRQQILLLSKFCQKKELAKQAQNATIILQKEKTPQFQEGVNQLLSQEVQKEQIINYEEDGKKYVEDYTKRPTKLQFEENNFDDKFSGEITLDDDKKVAWKMNTSSNVDMQDNPLALQVLSEKQIDITDERIKIKSAKLDDLKIIKMGSSLKSIDLGEVYVTPHNSVNIDEVDVDNIPEDKDIQLEKVKKELYAYGVQEKGDDNDGSKIIQFQNQIIEDVNLQQFKDKYLFKFEQKFIQLNKKSYLKSLIRQTPIMILICCFFDTVLDLYFAKRESYQTDAQQLDFMNEYLQQKQNELLLQDSSFSRNEILK